ncbi:MAG: hypothetical protein RLZZ293_236, partial [Pseudomonadota bacterium]
MNLNLNTWRLKSLLTKLMIYLMALYCLLIVASLVITNYLVINMQEYKSRIEQSIYAKTGYNLHLGNIQTKLNYYYLPEVIIDNLILTNPKDKKHNLQIKQIDLVLSYRSIWELQPIFKQISINGTNLIIERFADGHIVLNGLPLYTPQQISLDKVRSPFDWQKWLLKQGDINLEHIDISYQDYKDNLSPITIYNIQLSIHNNWRNYHQIALAIYGKSQSKMLYANLNWHGGNFANFTQWKDAEFQVGSINYNLSNWLVSVEHLLPQLANLNSPSFNPVISAKLNQGNLEYLQSNFDLQNFKLALADIDVINLPKLGGNLAIKLVQPKYYSIKASNLTVTTKSGALFDHAVINGEYTQGKSGKVVLSNTNLVALNNLLNFFDATSGLSLQGTLSNIDYSWQGFFTKPKDFNISAQFKDIGLVSSNPKYPNLSHVSGGFIIGKNRGELNLSLNDSVFRDDSLFLIPYEFKNLTTKLDWQTQNQQFKLTIHPTSLETKDFKGNLSGSYTRLLSNPNDSGYLSMQAHVDRVKTAKVGDYLPKSIPLSVHQWLNIALIGGDAVNANMTFAGALANFPFQDGKGLFYITSDIDNATLRYVKDWPVLNQIYGQFILKNTTITINAKKAKINNNYLDPTSVVIPDYASTTGVYLVANGYAHGSTANFMHYLAQTPINNLIGKLPEKIQTNGNGKVKIWLKVPFSDPLHTQVNGSYTFLDNQLKFDLPIPQLSRVNGILNFSHHGINISNLTLSAFDSKLNLSAEQTTDGKIKFLVNSPQLNYGEVSKFYLPSLANIVEGKSSTNVNFIIGKHGIDNLQAQSKLIGVTVNLPKPFTKSSESSSNFELQLFTQKSHAIEINWQYSNLLYGKQIFPEHGRATHGQIMTTKSTKLNDNELEALTTIKLNLPQVNILEWIKQVSSMLSSTRKIELSNKTATKQISKPRQFFPLLIQLNSNFSLGNVDLGVGNINVIADQHSSYFNLYTPVTNGQGEFNYMNNQLSLDLTDYSILIKH